MSDEISFYREDGVVHGRAERLSPLVERVVAPNPGPFTYHGTNSYLVGDDEVALVDPGPDIDAHVDALMAALGGRRLTHIVLTHTHHDHAPAAHTIAARTGAPIAARSRVVPRAATGGFSEAPHVDLSADIELGEASVLRGSGWTLEVVPTPGHTSNHLCFALAEEGALFTGDHIMGWSTSVVTPPDGDMRAYMDSLERLAARSDSVYLSGHGPPVTAPGAFVRAYMRHRRQREDQILAAIDDGLATVAEIVARLYTHVPTTLHRAASYSVLAHLIDLVGRGEVACTDAADLEGRYRRMR